MLTVLVSFTSFASAAVVDAHEVGTASEGEQKSGVYYDGVTGQRVTLDAVLSTFHKGQIVLVSEQHGFKPHHQNQRDLLVAVSGAAFPLSVGMEFFDYTKQLFVDQFTRDEISEETFLKQMGWGGDNFDNYRFQVRLPHYRSGRTIALNAPRSLTGKVAKLGLASLTEEDKALLPPDFTLGAETLFERFQNTMKDHVPAEKIPNYFAAHSIWDETMAWRATEFLKENPEHWLMIVVGDFHVAYQDGLVARLKARGAQDVVSISQVNSKDLTAEEKDQLLLPDPKYGPRATFIFDANE